MSYTLRLLHPNDAIILCMSLTHYLVWCSNQTCQQRLNLLHSSHFDLSYWIIALNHEVIPYLNHKNWIVTLNYNLLNSCNSFVNWTKVFNRRVTLHMLCFHRSTHSQRIDCRLKKTIHAVTNHSIVQFSRFSVVSFPRIYMSCAKLTQFIPLTLTPSRILINISLFLVPLPNLNSFILIETFYFMYMYINFIEISLRLGITRSCAGNDVTSLSKY